MSSIDKYCRDMGSAAKSREDSPTNVIPTPVEEAIDEDQPDTVPSIENEGVSKRAGTGSDNKRIVGDDNRVSRREDTAEEGAGVDLSVDGRSQLEELDKRLFKLEMEKDSIVATLHRIKNGIPPPPLSPAQSETPNVRILPQILPKFWDKFDGPGPTSLDKPTCAIEVLVGDQVFMPMMKQTQRSNSPPEGKKISDPLTSTQNDIASRELELLKGKYMPERIRINVFSLRYLLRVILSPKPGNHHLDKLKSLTVLRPYKEFMQKKDIILKKFLGLRQSIEAHENMVKSMIDSQGGQDNSSAGQSNSRFKFGKNNDKIQNGDEKDVPRVLNQEECSSAVTDNIDLTVDTVDELLMQLQLSCCLQCSKQVQQDFSNSKIAKDFLDCFTNFVNDYLIPVHETFRNRASSRVSFGDLWHVFQPGDHVVMKRDLDFEYSGEWYTSIWRVLAVQGGRMPICAGPPPLPLVVPDLPLAGRRPPPTPAQEADGMLPFTIDTYHLDHNGFMITPARRRFFIRPFPGDREVTDLEIYPVEFSEDPATLMANAIKFGRRFLDYAEAKNGRYVECQGQDLWTKDKIDEPMIIDMGQYFDSTGQADRPRWFNPEEVDVRETDHCCRVPCVPYENRPSIVRDYHVDENLMKDHVEGRQYFSDYYERNMSKSKMTDEDLAICTHRLFGLRLRSRRWARVLIDDLSDVTRSKEELKFNQLVLSPDSKHMIQSQVQEHFRKRRLQGDGNEIALDVVRGKGQGLTILIHGAPGVGKTATAECVADMVERPLYPLTCGDLGTSAKEVESNLSVHLSHATRWDCILLLDEADVFMAKRTKEDYTRNATVSVFLRMLEYYKGVLILTTNRIGTFDEAFKSRVHLSLFYPNFNEQDTVAVFRVFVEITRKANANRENFYIDGKGIRAWAREHFNSVSEEERWNGRQIRNAFHTAVALAEYEAREQLVGLDVSDPNAYKKEIDIAVKLGRAQFEKVARTVTQFDKYIQETLGSTYAERLDHEKVRKNQPRSHKKKNSKVEKEAKHLRGYEAYLRSREKEPVSDSEETGESKNHKPKRKVREKQKERENKGPSDERLYQSSSSESD